MSHVLYCTIHIHMYLHKNSSLFFLFLSLPFYISMYCMYISLWGGGEGRGVPPLNKKKKNFNIFLKYASFLKKIV